METSATLTPATTIITRTSAPATTDGMRWHVELSDTPPRAWLDFFKTAGRSDGIASPHLVVFDRDSASFKSNEHRVEQWIETLDRWIASTDARYRLSLDEAERERSMRRDAEAKQRERIQQMNDRFKGL